MNEAIVALYEAHPVNAKSILDALLSHEPPQDSFTPADLFPLDQDHYGGAEATEALALRAGMQADDVVLDLCSGLGGPARYVAWRFGCTVTGIDLTEARVQDARFLTEMVGLAGRVGFQDGDVTSLPFSDGAFTVCLSQESFLHVADKARLLAGCRRVLRPGGRIAFSDWTAMPGLSDEELARLEHAFSAPGIATVAEYDDHLHHARFERVEVDDLSDEWKPIVAARLARLRGLREGLIERLGEKHVLEWEDEYAFMVELVQEGKLGGARFVASVPS